MKKVHMITLFFTVLLMSACADLNANGESGTLIESELTEREEAVLLTTADQAFVYDFEVGDDHNEATVWIEKYEFGELVEEDVGHVRNQVSEDGFIIVTLHRANAAQSQPETVFSIGISSDGGSGVLRTSDVISEDSEEHRGMILENTASSEIDLSNGEVIIGSIIHSTTEEGLSSLSPDFYEDIEGNSEEIEDYEAVYIIKSEFN